MRDLLSTILPFIESGQETEQIEFKERLDLSERPHRAELARDISALANRDGGLIVVGVLDRRHRVTEQPEDYVVGWEGDLDETERILRDALAIFCDPPPRITLSAYIHPATQRQLLIIQVPRSYARPHAIKRPSGPIQEHDIWVRDGPMVRRATPKEYEQMVLGQRRVILVNFHHPLTETQREQARLLMNVRIDDVIDVPVHFSHDVPFHEQARTCVDRVGLTSHQWQTKDIVVNLPGFSPAAAAILAELHGRMGHFPNVLRLKPCHAEGGTTYEVAEIMNLQEIRDTSRTKR